MNTISGGPEKIGNSLDESDERIRKSSKPKSSTSKEKHRQHRRRHTDDSADVSKEDSKRHSSKKAKKKKKKKKKERSPSPGPVYNFDERPSSLDDKSIVEDGSLSDDSQRDMILKAEVSLPSRRNLLVGRSHPDLSGSESSPSDDSSAEGESRLKQTSSSGSRRRDPKTSSRKDTSRTSSRNSSRHPRRKNRISKHKQELIDALTPIEGEYLTVRRNPKVRAVSPKPPPKPALKPTRRMSHESFSEDSRDNSGSKETPGLLSPADELLKKELRAQMEQSLLSRPGAVSVSSQASQHEKTKGKVDFKPTIAKIGTEPETTSSAASQLEELRANRKPLAPKKTKADEDDEDRHKRELMRELTPTDYKTVTRTRATISKPPPVDDKPVLKDPSILGLPPIEESTTTEKSKEKKRSSNPFSTIKKLGKRSSHK